MKSEKTEKDDEQNSDTSSQETPRKRSQILLETFRKKFDTLPPQKQAALLGHGLARFLPIWQKRTNEIVKKESP